MEHIPAAHRHGHAEHIPDPVRMPVDVLELEKPDAPPEHRITLRVWRHPMALDDVHSYIGGTAPPYGCGLTTKGHGGLTPRLDATIPFTPEKTTFERLRIPIETVSVKGMLRRTALFQEILAVMLELENPHDYPPANALAYRFAIWPDDTPEESPPGTLPTLIPKEDEEELISKWLPDPLARDLIIVPQTQIDRGDRCTLVRCAGDEEGKDSLDVMTR